jgi:hypothetical protein
MSTMHGLVYGGFKELEIVALRPSAHDLLQSRFDLGDSRHI